MWSTSHSAVVITGRRLSSLSIASPSLAAPSPSGAIAPAFLRSRRLRIRRANLSARFCTHSSRRDCLLSRRGSVLAGLTHVAHDCARGAYGATSFAQDRVRVAAEVAAHRSAPFASLVIADASRRATLSSLGIIAASRFSLPSALNAHGAVSSRTAVCCGYDRPTHSAPEKRISAPVAYRWGAAGCRCTIGASAGRHALSSATTTAAGQFPGDSSSLQRADSASTERVCGDLPGHRNLWRRQLADLSPRVFEEDLVCREFAAFERTSLRVGPIW